MIDTQENTLTSFLYKAQAAAIAKQEKQLISWTKEITAVNLLAVFQMSKAIHKNRLFWTNETGEFAFVGFGNVQKLTTDSSDISNLQMKWEQLIQDALIYNPYDVAGTGIVAIGGMAFDPLKAATPLWDKFPTNQLTIPKYVLVKNKDTYYFTINHFVTIDEKVEEIMAMIQGVETEIEQATEWNRAKTQTVIHKNEIEKEQWKQAVTKAVTEIRNGYAQKIVMAREMRVRLNRDAQITAIIDNLMQTQQHSYIFAIAHGEDCFIGATPERLVKVAGDKLLSTCLAGTAPRGETHVIDQGIADELLQDPKNLEEHDYVVQMIKKNIEAACEEINMPTAPVIFPLRNLQHLYTPISATLKQGYTIFDMIKKLHPTPALGGAPRKESLAFIRREEVLDRGWYGAPIGWLDSSNNGEFAVAIRSGLIQGQEVSLFAGCGVMRDSDAEMEYQETNVKFLPMLHALEVENDAY